MIGVYIHSKELRDKYEHYPIPVRFAEFAELEYGIYPDFYISRPEFEVFMKLKNGVMGISGSLEMPNYIMICEQEIQDCQLIRSISIESELRKEVLRD
jgi:hypothetical protein